MAAYLMHAFARSRAGFANVLHLDRLSADGTAVIGEGHVVIDGNAFTATPSRPAYTTLEGPKIYKRNAGTTATVHLARGIADKISYLNVSSDWNASDRPAMRNASSSGIAPALIRCDRSSASTSSMT